MTALRATSAASYRSDIDGLRAVSILAVVGYHAGVPWLSGGYVGVDVFFVISGYLITGLLAAELQREGRIDFARFYARRVRRLLPAAALVISVTIAAGAMLLSPALGEVQGLAKSAIAALLICANLWFLHKRSDYFAVDVDRHPLLHTWSLSVEEQFYLVWPLLMLIGWEIGRRRGHAARGVVAILALATLGSFALAVVWVESDVYAFYLMPARAWELGIGALLAVLAPRLNSMPRAFASQLALAGVVLIIASCVLLDSDGDFPFPVVAFPVLATALVIAGNLAAPACVASRFLSMRCMVVIGLASYALYLWHWPILTIGRIYWVGEDSLPRNLLLVAASVILAILTLRYVEEPLRFRFRRGAAAHRVVGLGIGVTAVLVVMAGATGWLARTLPLTPEESNARFAASDYPELQLHCHASYWPAEVDAATCHGEADRPRIFIWGDSHANHWVPALSSWVGSLEDAPVIEQWTLDACPSLFDALPTAVLSSHRVGFHECRDFNDHVRLRLKSILPESRLGVVLASNWWYREGGVRWKNTEPAHSFDLAAVGQRESLAALERYMRSSLEEITQSGYSVLVILQSPVLRYDAPTCILRRGPGACAETLAGHHARANRVNTIIRAVVDEVPGARVLDPADLLCGDELCPAVVSGFVAYTDNHHLSASVVRALVPQLEAELMRLLH